MSRRKLEALRALAERPGTEAEGIVARQILARLEAKQGIPGRVEAKRYDHLWECACGSILVVGEKCDNDLVHLDIQDEIRAKFKPGDRVYYNKWAYTANCAGVVAAYVRLKAPNGDHPWAWISVKFDYLKSARQIPIYSAKGWHLSHKPVDRATLIQTGLREGMEKMEGLGVEQA